jgi:DNA-binding PadR family transcriptional regulator
MSTPADRQLTTTSYAILGLLAVRPWSMYALAKQLRRSLRHIWPRAESNVYAEPKRLMAAGLVTAEIQTTGKRERTIYAITDAGRRALADWVGTESGPSRFESELLLKILFANVGTKEEMLDNLHRFAEEAAAARALWGTVAEEYLSGVDPFPERLHINALFFRWVWAQVATNANWAEWAIEQVAAWPDVEGPPASETSLETFREALRAGPPAR